MNIRQATYSDIDSLMQIFEDAKKIMRSSGNLHQWTGGYPPRQRVLDDISNGYCHVIMDEDQIIGTMSLIPGPDPTYSYIEGAWLDESAYYVIHRIATSAPGRNVAKQLFDWAYAHISDKGCNVIRIDTHRDNCIMKHVLTRYGFSQCGVIYLEDGAPRDAYQK